MKREIKGFALAPLPTVLPFTLLFGIILLDQPDDDVSVIEAWLQLVSASYGASLLIGVPVHLALHRLRRCSLLSYLFTTTLAVAATAVMFVLFQLLAPASAEANPFGFTLASRAGVAATSGFKALPLTGSWVFWRTAIRASEDLVTGFRKRTNR